MKTSYHLCFTSHDEVLFRNIEDHNYFLNMLALQAYRKRVEVLVDAEMSTHVHLNIVAHDPVGFGRDLRMSYTKYFNYRYGRKGRFGQKGCYILKAEGYYHNCTLMNYILRNGLHHGASATAFGYPFCSVREYFRADLGFPENDDQIITNRNDMVSFLPRHSEFPDEYVMDSSGVFLRKTFMEIAQVEQMYMTPRNYLYQMNRLTDENWMKEQMKDDTGVPISLFDIEPLASERDVSDMLKNESGKRFRADALLDLQLCQLIDNELIISYGGASVYELNDTQKTVLFKRLRFDYHLPDRQIRRCLVMQ